MDKKKNYSLLKVIGIAFLLYVVLTWFIPVGSFSSGEFEKGLITPVGLYGIFTTPVYSFAVFAQYFVLILCVGGLYGVLNKTGVYQKIVDFFASKNRTIVLVSTIIINAVITSVFGETMVIFILLPFFISILLKLGYDKLSSLASTVGASLVGMSASICGNMAIYKNYFNLDPKVFILFNIIMFIILIFLLCMYVTIKDKKNSNSCEKISDIPLYESVKKNKKSSVPMIIILVISVLLLVLGLYNWEYSVNVGLFNDLHDKITSISLFGTDIIVKIFGQIVALGYLTNYDISAILVISSIIIAWVYSIGISDYIDSFKSGALKMLVPGIYVVLAASIFSSVVTANGGNISLTISNFILNLSNDFSIATGTLTGIVSSFFYNDYLYMLNGLYGIVSLYNVNMMPLILSLFQSIFGIMMFILPVSITLICGLKYLEISYKDWISYIWKFMIQIFSVSMIGLIILSMLI